MRVDPRNILTAGSDRAAGAEPERRQHLRQRAARTAQHDAGADEHHAESERRDAVRGALPVLAEARQKILPG